MQVPSSGREANSVTTSNVVVCVRGVTIHHIRSSSLTVLNVQVTSSGREAGPEVRAARRWSGSSASAAMEGTYSISVSQYMYSVLYTSLLFIYGLTGGPTELGLMTIMIALCVHHCPTLLYYI
jgi:hypothetical protein